FVREPELDRTVEEPGGYREVLRDRVFLGVIGLNLGYISAGYTVFELLPVFAKNETHVDETQIGIVYLVATLSLVVAQLPVARLLEGRSRMRALAVMPVLFAVAWFVILAAGAALRATPAAVVFGVAAVIFGVGSCFQGPTQGALVSDLAPPRMRGRYMA